MELMRTCTADPGCKCLLLPCSVLPTRRGIYTSLVRPGALLILVLLRIHNMWGRLGLSVVSAEICCHTRKAGCPDCYCRVLPVPLLRLLCIVPATEAGPVQRHVQVRYTARTAEAAEVLMHAFTCYPLGLTLTPGRAKSTRKQQQCSRRVLS